MRSVQYLLASAVHRSVLIAAAETSLEFDNDVVHELARDLGGTKDTEKFDQMLQDICDTRNKIVSGKAVLTNLQSTKVGESVYLNDNSIETLRRGLEVYIDMLADGITDPLRFPNEDVVILKKSEINTLRDKIDEAVGQYIAAKELFADMKLLSRN